MGFVRTFMLTIGPISSVFDFATFYVLLRVFAAHEGLFHTGWFVESLVTQILVIFVIRTRRIPFFHSQPSRPLLCASLGVVLLGATLPMSPLAGTLGFTSLPGSFFGVLVAMIVIYLALVEVGKRYFFAEERRVDLGIEPLSQPRPHHVRRIHRRAARWIHPGPIRRRVG